MTPDAKGTAASTSKPAVRQPETDGMREDRRPASDQVAAADADVPATSSKRTPRKDPLPDPFPARKTDAPRQAGGSPRPKDPGRSDAMPSQ